MATTLDFVALAGAAIACSGLVAVAIAVVRARRLPETVLRRVDHLEEAAMADRQTLEVLIERAEDAFDRAERKRRSAAAAASKAEAANEARNGQPQTREEILREIRLKTGVFT